MQLRSRIFQWAHSDRVAAFAGLPGPQPKFPLGNLGTIQRQGPVDVAADVAQNHGPLAVLWIKKQPLVLISDERLARAVLAQGRDTFVTALPDALLGLPLSGDARLAEEGFGHGDIYRHGPGPISLLQPSWITGWLAECTPMVQAHLAERVEAFARETQAGPQPLFAALLRVVFQTLTRLTLGQELSHQAFDDMLELCLGPQRRTLGFEPLEQRENLYGTPRERLLEAIGKHISMAVRYPDENRRDLIGYLLEGRYALAESEWAPAFLRILEGACLPVAAQLTQSFALLAGHPDALEALEHEIDAADAEPSAYTLRNLPLLDGVYEESQRLAPAMPFIGRRVKEHRQVDLDGKTLPGGTAVLVNLAHVQRHTTAFADPTRFQPERWNVARETLEDGPLGLGAARRTSPVESLGEWLSKLVLFTWLRGHSVLTSGRENGGRDTFVGALHLPASLRATLYSRRSAAASAGLRQANAEHQKLLTLLPGAPPEPPRKAAP